MSILHVANGHATTGLIALSGMPGRTQIWADPLNEGPVPGNVSDDELLMIRARFLASRDDAADVADDLRRWREAVDDDAGYDELEPRHLAAVFKDRLPVDAAQFALAARAWSAYRSPDPRAIEELLKGDTSALPFLAAALARHLEEFPSAADGLSRSERRLMEQALGGPAGIDAAFARMHHGETAYYIADSWFVDRARELSSASPALVDLSITADGGNRLPAGTIALTTAGRDVLSGGADRVRLCGIDRWLGGVHVQGRGPAWRWSSRSGHLVEA